MATWSAAGRGRRLRGDVYLRRVAGLRITLSRDRRSSRGLRRKGGAFFVYDRRTWLPGTPVVPSEAVADRLKQTETAWITVAPARMGLIAGWAWRRHPEHRRRTGRAGAGAQTQAQRSALGVFAIRIAGAGLAYATQVLFARLMGKAEYGVFATVWIWVTDSWPRSLLGLTQTLCRFVPQYRVRAELDLARGFLAGGAAVTLATAGAWRCSAPPCCGPVYPRSMRPTARPLPWLCWSCRCLRCRTTSRAWRAASIGPPSPSRRSISCARS
jgi:hypothetical protein